MVFRRNLAPLGFNGEAGVAGKFAGSGVFQAGKTP